MFGLGKMLGLGGVAKAAGAVMPGFGGGSKDPMLNQLLQRQMAPVEAQPGPLAGLGAGAAQVAGMGGQSLAKAPVEPPVDALAADAGPIVKTKPTGGTLGAAALMGGALAPAPQMRPKIGLMDMIRNSMLQRR